MRNTVDKILSDSAGTVMSSYAMTSGVDVVTQPVDTRRSIGVMTILMVMTGDVDIKFECSLDDVTYYIPKNTAGTTIGTIVDNLTETRWISFTPEVTPHMRFRFTPNSATTVTAYYVLQEEMG